MSVASRLWTLEKMTGGPEYQRIEVFHGDELDRVLVVDPLRRCVVRTEYPDGRVTCPAEMRRAPTMSRNRRLERLENAVPSNIPNDEVDRYCRPVSGLADSGGLSSRRGDGWNPVTAPHPR